LRQKSANDGHSRDYRSQPPFYGFFSPFAHGSARTMMP
jgi:hypothetical protein